MQCTREQQLQGEQVVVRDRYLYRQHECDGVVIYDERKNTKIKMIRRIFGFEREEVTINRLV